MTHVIGEAKKHLIIAQQRQKFYTDKNRREVSFEVDHQVLVSTANIKLKVPGAFIKVDWPISGGAKDRGGSIPRATASYI
jgi:hypothetical protein